ncbi:DUF4124 domain-containing protein [Vibrio hepatarius]|uniref:DUF4124 domain-containing protein n=1 Tax=Vibrio hepatarius TaxID=171383 RepID=UPI00142E8A1F|nr:DUF4124 domain-containing protein [Vibrio hepatarius]NIY83395.1 DUF4124 domain-containing protein [Vibrio hepatarius]NVJ56997.1 DUF4124 domain-containing protein [Vibrionaceae bacterium]
MKWHQQLVFLFVLQAPVAIAQTVYSWVDDNGVVHFSDNPTNGKVKAIQLPDHEQPAPPPKFDAPQAVEADENKNNDAKAESVGPLVVDIISPQHDQALRSNAGMITIQAEVNRKLAIGETLQLVMDNKRYGAPTNQPLWELKNIDRGSHSFVVQAIKDGKLIASSNPITVHLQRAIQKKAISQ